MTRALIIGISGQDGAYLARLLVEKGYEVHGTSRDHELATFTNLSRLGVRERVQLTSMVLSDFRSVMTALQRIRPDEIYSLAGQTSVERSFTYPVETFESILIGTINLLECIRLSGLPVRLYNASSSEVFGNCPEPANECTPFRPRSPYATAKAGAHHAVSNYREAYGIHASSGILFNHESPLRPARFVTQKVVRAAARIAAGSGERLSLGNLGVWRDWGWAPEYVEAMWRMLQRPVPDDFVIATGETRSLEEFVHATFARVGLDARDHLDLDPRLLRPADITQSRGDPSKASRLLGWRAATRLEGIIDRLLEAQMETNP